MVEEEELEVLEEETDTSGHGDATAPHATPTICLGTCGGYHPPVGRPFAQHWPYPNHSPAMRRVPRGPTSGATTT